MAWVASHLPRVTRFALVGVSNTLVTLASYLALLALGVQYLIAGAVAFALGAVNGYTWNRIWTWRAGRHQHAMLVKYVSVTAGGIALSALLLGLFVEVGGMARVPSQLIALPIATLVTYSGNHRWTFAEAGNRSACDERGLSFGRATR